MNIDAMISIAQRAEIQRTEIEYCKKFDVCMCGAAPYGRCRACGVKLGMKPYDPPPPDHLRDLLVLVKSTTLRGPARNRHERRAAAARARRGG